MEIYYDVDINFFFKVYDSPMYGGEGTVGYCTTSFKGCRSVSDEKIRAEYKNIVAEMASYLLVDASKLKSITREEYDTADKEESDIVELTNKHASVRIRQMKPETT